MRILFLLLALSFFACNRAPEQAAATSSYDRTSYMDARASLKAAGKQGLPVSEKAATAFAGMRDSLLRTYLRAGRFPLEGGFYSAKQKIAATPIFKALEAMPKGGLLHCHDLAIGSAWLLVDMALASPDCYVYWGESNERFLKGQLHFYKANEVPGGFMLAKDLEKLIPRFREVLYDLLTFDDLEVKNAKDIWGPFEEQFRMRLGFMHYAPVMVPYFVSAFDSLVNTGIQHVELRSILSDGMYDLEHPSGYYNIDSMVVVFKKAKAIIQKKHPEFSLKIIHSGIRFPPAYAVRADLAKAYRLKKSHPDMIVGYDLVGQEDAGLPTLRHLDCCWLKRDSLAAAYGVDVPLLLHDGESVWPRNDNLLDAVLLDVKRIGHGFNLFRYPQLEQRVKEAGICVEISPLSNFILGYSDDLRNHHGLGYHRRGIAISLNNDDPSIFAYHGTTYDFWVAAVAWGMDLDEIKKLAHNSLEYSMLGDVEKQKAIASWEQRWVAWEQATF
jgi:adenosine deaminase CECR1